MILAKDISFSYQHKQFTPVCVFQNAEASFEKGKLYVLYGPSGAGKSTLLSLLGGLSFVQEGEVYVDGQVLSKNNGEEIRRKRISYIFQDYCLFPYMNALENVSMAIWAKITQKAKFELAREQLYKLGLKETELYRKIKFLSGGQQQRVAIARALVTGADYLLADEPTGNLDVENAELVMGILTKLAHSENKCVIVASHSRDFKQRADMIYYIGDHHVQLETNDE